MKKNIKEGIDVGNFKDFIHRDKRADIESGTHEILGVLPDDAQSYYETIVSDSYKKCIERLAHYTGASPQTVNLPAAMGQVVMAIKKTQAIEAKNVRFFENLALETVLELPEFKWVKQAYEDDEISFDVKLGVGELQNAISQSEEAAEEDEPQEDGGLSDVEQANIDIAQELMGDTEIKLRRKLANALTQGNAVNKMYLFNVVKEKLDAVNPDLVNLYGLVTSIVQVLYYAMPPGIEGAAAGGGNPEAALGSEEVTDEGDGKYRIKARGQTFPYLVHEIVKGIGEYLSLTPETKGEMRKDHLEGETQDIISGPELYKKLMGLIPSDKTDLYPAIKQRILSLDIPHIKEIFANGGKGRAVINKIIQDIENEMGPEDEPYKDSYADRTDEPDEEGGAFL